MNVAYTDRCKTIQQWPGKSDDELLAFVTLGVLGVSINLSTMTTISMDRMMAFKMFYILLFIFLYGTILIRDIPYTTNF